VVGEGLSEHGSELVWETRTHLLRLCINHFFRAFHEFHFLSPIHHCHHFRNHIDDACCRYDMDRPGSAEFIPLAVEHVLSLLNVSHQPLLVCVLVMYYSGLQLARFVVHLQLLALEFRRQLFLQSMTSKLGSLESGSKIDADHQPTSQPKLQLLQLLKFMIIQLHRYVKSDELKLHLLIIRRLNFSLLHLRYLQSQSFQRLLPQFSLADYFTDGSCNKQFLIRNLLMLLPNHLNFKDYYY
jgi:hypothetical protein